MRSTKQFSVTLPNEMAQMVKTKISSGEYAGESEVIRDGAHALYDPVHDFVQVPRPQSSRIVPRKSLLPKFQQLSSAPSSALSQPSVTPIVWQAGLPSSKLMIGRLSKRPVPPRGPPSSSSAFVMQQKMATVPIPGTRAA